MFDQVKRGDPQLRAIAAGLFLGLGLLLAGLWYVQVISARRYRADLLDQSFRIVRLPAIRGKIVDRNGFRLAENRPTYNVNLYFEEMRRNFRFEYTNRVLPAFKRENPAAKPAGKVDELLQSKARYCVVSNLMSHVSSLIQEPEVLDEKQFTNHYNNSRSLPFPLVRDLSPRQIARFVENSQRLPNLALEAQPIRFYPFHSTAAHLLGHIQKDDSPGEDEEISFQFRLPDWIGVMGVEKAFDDELRGRPGVKSVLVNNLQYRQAEETWTAPQPGANIVLTIDFPIQRSTQKALLTLGAETRGAAIVMDCRNGDVLAMESVPSFDPNIYSGRISDEEYAKLLDPVLQPQFNRATYGRYPPGSILKTVVALAGLESGTLDPQEQFESKGWYQIDGRGHKWGDTAGPGSFDFEKAFYRSSNPYFQDHGRKIGFERLAEMGRRFGLGQKTGLNTRQETGGYFPDPSDKIKKDGSRWMEGDTANLCIGQGDIEVTPLQMAVMTAAIANGGVVFEPRVIDRIEPQEQDAPAVPIRFPAGQIRRELKIKRENLQIVRNAMLQDVEHKDERGRPDGTGAKAAIQEMRVCGKTGTAQIKEGGKVKSYITWFIAFAPFETPRYAVVVMVETEHGSGAGICAPVAHDIFKAIAERERGIVPRDRASLAAN